MLGIITITGEAGRARLGLASSPLACMWGDLEGPTDGWACRSLRAPACLSVGRAFSVVQQEPDRPNVSLLPAQESSRCA